jgi:hypothetical protein
MRPRHVTEFQKAGEGDFGYNGAISAGIPLADAAILILPLASQF